MTDIFLRCAPQNWIRAGMMMACIERWRMEPDTNLHLILSSPTTGATWICEHYRSLTLGPVLALEDFHWTSRAYADENATSDPYVLADDDRIPMGKDWLPKALEHWKVYNANHQYVMLVDRSAVTMDDVTLHHPRLRESRNPVEENPYFCGPNYLSYKGAIPYQEFSGPPNRQDGIIEEWAKKNGKKQAIMMNVLSNHMGVGFSQAQPLLWGRY